MIIKIMLCWNVMLVLVAAWTYNAIAKTLGLGFELYWLGGVGLFINYANTKQLIYYPVLTDTTAFCLGILFLYATIHRKLFLLSGVSLLLAFTWPGTMYYTLPAITLLGQGDWVGNLRMKKYINHQSIANILNCIERKCNFLQVLGIKDNYVCAISTRVLVAIISIPGLYVVLRTYYGKWYWSAPMDEKIQTIVFGTVYLLLLLKITFKLLHELTTKIELAIGNIRIQNIFLSIVLYVIYKLISHTTANPLVPAPNTIYTYLTIMIGFCVNQPILFITQHFIYFGPIVILVAFMYNKIVNNIKEQWQYLVIILILINIYSILEPESRHIIVVYPAILVLWLANIKRQFGAMLIVLYSIIAFALTKVWMSFNQVTWFGGSFDYLREYPKQYYFMNHGPWTNNESFLFNLTIMCIFSVGAFILIAINNSKHQKMQYLHKI